MTGAVTGLSASSRIAGSAAGAGCGAGAGSLALGRIVFSAGGNTSMAMISFSGSEVSGLAVSLSSWPVSTTPKACKATERYTAKKRRRSLPDGMTGERLGRVRRTSSWAGFQTSKREAGDRSAQPAIVNLTEEYQGKPHLAVIPAHEPESSSF
mgnify:CR=1 FL=1